MRDEKSVGAEGQSYKLWRNMEPNELTGLASLYLSLNIEYQ